MRLTRLLTAGLLAGLMLLGNAQADKILIFLGDSLTDGYMLPRYQAYPAEIQKLISKDALQWRVINAGLSGDTTAGGLKRLPKILEQKPDFVMIALGYNDVARQVPLAEIQSNLKEMVTTLKEKKIGVALAGVFLPESVAKNERLAFQAMFHKLALKYRLPLYPNLLHGVDFETQLMEDGLHPNHPGHIQMAHEIYVFLKPHLSGTASKHFWLF